MILREHRDIEQKFGCIKESKIKNIDTSNIQIHPDFVDLYQCYKAVFRCLEDSASMAQSFSTIDLWQKSASTFYLMYGFSDHLHIKGKQHANLKIKIRSLPQQHSDIEALLDFSSRALFKLLRTQRYKIDRINPIQLQELLNQNVSQTVLLEVNHEYSSKPHSTIGMNTLAKLMGFTRNHFTQRTLMIQAKRKNILDELARKSSIVQKLLDHPDYDLKPNDIWSIK